MSVMLLAFECPPDILINRSRPPIHEATGGYGFPHAIPTRVPHKTLLFFGGGKHNKRGFCPLLDRTLFIFPDSF